MTYTYEMFASFKKIPWRLTKWSLGLLSLYISKRLRNRGQARPFDIVLIDAVMDRVLSHPQMDSFDEAGGLEYMRASRDTAYWHGTGKLQYDHGRVVDVFTSILQSGNLRTAKDIFDPRMGEMVSLSVARQRMYARIYADMHVSGGVRRTERYGSPRFWTYYFIMASILTVAKEMNVRSPRSFGKNLSTWRKTVQERWSVKIHQNPEAGAGAFFTNGSDISHNYPILIGMSLISDQNWLKTGDGIKIYERRSRQPVPVSSFTHIEVPFNKVASVKKELRSYGYKTPVFAIEQCEVYASHMHFSQLVT